MRDLIRRDDAKDVFQRLAYDDWNQGVSTTWANAFSECADIIDDIPTVDSVEVVRCRECEHWGLSSGCSRLNWWPPNNWYCASGKRREDGDT